MVSFPRTPNTALSAALEAADSSVAGEKEPQRADQARAGSCLHAPATSLSCQCHAGCYSPEKKQALQSKGWETTSPQGFGHEQVPTQALSFPYALKIHGENEALDENQLQRQLWRGCKATIVSTKTAALGVSPPKLWPQDKYPHTSQNPKHIF